MKYIKKFRLFESESSDSPTKKEYCGDISKIFDYLIEYTKHVEFIKYDESGYECKIGKYILKKDESNDIFTINDENGEGLTNITKSPLEFKRTTMNGFKLPDGRNATNAVWYETHGCDVTSGAYSSMVGQLNMLIKKQKK